MFRREQLDPFARWHRAGSLIPWLAFHREVRPADSLCMPLRLAGRLRRGWALRLAPDDGGPLHSHASQSRTMIADRLPPLVQLFPHFISPATFRWDGAYRAAARLKPPCRWYPRCARIRCGCGRLGLQPLRSGGCRRCPPARHALDGCRYRLAPTPASHGWGGFPS